ncbi:MAG: hypothetical protein PVJ49_20740 [Acidobacteriota bacterium]
MSVTRRVWPSLSLSLLLATAACGDGPVSPGDILDDLTETFETQNVVFHYSRGDSVDSSWQQSYHDWITDLLGVQLPVKLRFYKYTSRSQLAAITGMETNGFAEPEVYSLHTIWPYDGHEAAHVYLALVGKPSNFFNEGLAVALATDPGLTVWNSRWNGTPVYAHTQLLISTNRLLPLSSMLTTDDFRGVDEWVSYGESGSFCLYLIEQYGIGPMLQFVGMSSQFDSRARIESNMRAVWGQDLATLEAAWLEFINGWSG